MEREDSPREVRGDIWAWYDRGHWLAIPTNGTVRHDGSCVMGRGLALQAARRFPDLPARIGRHISAFGNRVGAFAPGLLTFPVKDRWASRASLELINASARDLALAREVLTLDHPELAVGPVVLPRVGCGNGRLAWEDVRPVLCRHLDARWFLIVDVAASGGPQS